MGGCDEVSVLTRLALDVGSSSIGWLLYEVVDGAPVGIIDGGSRIFGDGREPKTGQSLAVGRRMARSMRRRRDRYLKRRATLMKRMAEAGLMPANPVEAAELVELDPYELRAQALDAALPLTHLGRAFFHLNQRRGFKSNRRSDKGSNEGGIVAEASARLDMAMMASGARTYGEFLHMRRRSAEDPRSVPAVRTRINPSLLDEDGKETAGYDFYPDRHHLEDEFQAIWAAQASHHPELTAELRDQIFETIFFQRPLKPMAVGRCAFVNEPRLPKAHPLTQARTLYETVNMLRIVSPGLPKRRLTRDERDKIVTALNGKKPTKSPSSTKLSLKEIAKVIKLDPHQSFSLETASRDAIACDPVRMSLAHPDRFGPAWSSLNVDEQWELIDRLREEQDAATLILWIMERYGFDRKKASAIADAPLPEGFSRLGNTATRRVLEVLIEGTPSEEMPTYNEAVAHCGWHHSQFATGEVMERLPYYGQILERHIAPGTSNPQDDDITRFGRITNPTVHIGLGQVRRLVNRVIEIHGRPDEVVIELARELKMGEEEKRRLTQQNKRNQKAAELRSQKLIEELGVEDTGANRAILRIWEETSLDVLKRFCPYSGAQISASMLFDGSCDIDHILPYSRTLDDSFGNKVICLKSANREKRNKTPWEAWGGTSKWPLIEANLDNLPANKRWRFQPDAMSIYEGERDFVARALVDTQYLSRVTREYLECLYPDALTQGRRPIWVVSGRLTELLRRHWGLNSLLPDSNKGTAKAKNRQDHRHHMIDAAVIGATDQGLVKRISDVSKSNVENGLEELAGSIQPPWENFRDDLRKMLMETVVSHRSDHGQISLLPGESRTTGQLHNDTAYGFSGQSSKDLPLVVTRKPIDTINASNVDKVRDPDLRSALWSAIAGKDGKDLQAAIENFRMKEGPYHRIRRVRIIEPVHVIPIKDKLGRIYKGFKGDSNHCYEIWRLPDGKIVHQVVSTFNANQGIVPRPHPAAKRLIRLHKNDMVKVDESKFGSVVAVVVKFDTNGGLALVPNNESNADQRYRKDKEDVFLRYQAASFMRAGGRRIHIDETGRFRDPKVSAS